MNKHLILIDDDPIYRFIIEKMAYIVYPAINIHHCENGLKGIECIKSLVDIENEIIILLDINMPVLDGWGMLEELKSNNIIDKNVSVFLVSSSTDEEDIIRSKSYDFIKNFFHKPLSIEVIQSIIFQD
ncbi:response regulator [Algoriphagus yeomjeoni]|uniref:Response regulator receiver domain-containing protein n=1 Tax=Algoriphagus yeomjeoni TaxID=291403 RepID=A0A327P3K6_9BACT|nr:response regulator [Algoriphagus yeomjeoni]RAI85644.1 response regulator receiver domain-containing protein [Algoriphagus yeomjeoni]